ncbi:ATP-dependent helicase [Ferrovibrio sp.]|uniref:ATP-dependent helicase n=1 Tax=Ferrovibrio sp. TaxID=1917215 RepID=UPI001B495D09|nr:UvrD-helicase domain-containing protein [Ferrovibrio sp.]MBP7066417.1 UvrD-helicase domain-containing protein [Ferrovibrio sp.]
MSDPFDLAGFDPEPPAPQAPPPPPPPWLTKLNPAQAEAVSHLHGPLLVLAGAGTGKTRVLVNRLANILYQRLAWPSQILAVTFTNKAAREMRERVEQLVGAEAAAGLWLGTFHGIANRILKRHAEVVGLKNNFTILDADDQLRLVKQVLDLEGIDEKQLPPRLVAGQFDRWKDKGLLPDQIPQAERGFAEGKGLRLYQLYAERLLQLNACDFGDLLLHNLTIFRQRRDILERYQRQFRFILVDEYQDSNVSQYLWLRLLAQAHKNICCVGDDDQSVYGWRGAEVGNILRFEKDFEQAHIVRLERNYRSTPHILAAASGLIAHNTSRLGKTLWTDIAEGDKVIVQGVWDGDEEARMVGDEIEALERAGQSLDQVAILVRAGHLTRAFEERFITIGMKYRVIGGLRFYERKEIRDAIAYFRVVLQPDDDLAFERIVNLPKRGLGDSTLQALHRAARAAQLSLTATLKTLLETDEIKPKPRATLKTLLNDFERWRGLVAELPHAEVAAIILEESGYIGMWQADKTPEAPGRLENLRELLSALGEFENLAGFLDHVALVMDAEQATGLPMVSLMTLHAAKGLEFDYVFLPGWEEDLFPSRRAVEGNGVAGLEEERRLAYVGITRARRRAHISFAANRRIYNQWASAVPSRFIDELPAEHVEQRSQAGLYRGAQNHAFGGAFAGSGFSAPNAGHSWNLSRQGGGRVIEGRARAVADSPSSQAPRHFEIGERVFHQKFGYGRIRAVDGNKLLVAFDKAGEKKVIDSFVENA